MSIYRHFNGMCWPVPCEALEQLTWRLIHSGESLDRSALLCAASVLSAYRELIALPQRERNARIRELRKGPGSHP